MTGLRPSSRRGLEVLDVHPAVTVPEAEYRRLLGYPRQHEPGERADELAAGARQWYAAHGRPWIYLREVELAAGDGLLRIDGMEFDSRRLLSQLQQAGAGRAVLVAVSAGRGCEEHARELWTEGKPDEYYFLESFGSAVVEQLVALANGRLCDRADRAGLMALPHYRPGYTGWDIADQGKLFALITRGRMQPFPEPLEVLSSGMLRPKKSLLALVGLAARTGRAGESVRRTPCASCAFTPCQFRRAPHRPANVATARAQPAPSPL